MNNLTGYAPPARGLCFDGDSEKWEEWEVKFLAYLNLKKLKKVVMQDGGPTTAAKLEEAFSELVQVLDSRSLHLVMRDARDNGREAMRILRNHYAGRGKQRIVSLYKNLCNMKMKDGMNLTDYIIKGESVAAALKSAGEVISDGLLQSMLLNGLPDSYKPFEDIITQKEKVMTFADFKAAIRNFEENRRVSVDSMGDKFSSVMKLQHDVSRDRSVERNCDYRNSGYNSNNQTASQNRFNKITCYSCGGVGHKSAECPSNKTLRKKIEETKWCSFCESNKHNTRSCMNKELSENQHQVKVAAIDVEDDGQLHSFCFGVSSHDNDGRSTSSVNESELLVDSGATEHILNEEKNFVNFNEDYIPDDHFLELANGEKVRKAVKARGVAKVHIRDENGVLQEALLKDALYIPSFPHNIFSVKSATRKGAGVCFRSNCGTLMAENGTKFPINSKNGLYYLNLRHSQGLDSRHSSTMYARLGNTSVGRVVNGTKSYADILCS